MLNDVILMGADHYEAELEPGPDDSPRIGMGATAKFRKRLSIRTRASGITLSFPRKARTRK